jgi:hypothetical protein
MRVINLGNDHIFAYVRTGRQGERVLVLANFSEHTQPIAANEVRLYGLGYRFHEVVTRQRDHAGRRTDRAGAVSGDVAGGVAWCHKDCTGTPLTSHHKGVICTQSHGQTIFRYRQ